MLSLEIYNSGIEKIGFMTEGNELMSLGWSTFVIGIALTFGVSLLVGLMVARKNKKIDTVEALKGAE